MSLTHFWRPVSKLSCFVLLFLTTIKKANQRVCKKSSRVTLKVKVSRKGFWNSRRVALYRCGDASFVRFVPLKFVCNIAMRFLDDYEDDES